jgi:hypothetical protein
MKKLTNAEVIYNFKDLLDKERLSDQIGYSNRFILNHLLNFRSTLIKRKKRENKLSDLNYQTITLNLEEVPDEKFPCVPGSNCILLRTTSILPYTIDLKSITTPINKTGEVTKISEIDPDMIKYKLHSKIPAQLNNFYYYLQNTGEGVYIYIWCNGPIFLKSISVKGIFYKPFIIEAMKDCAGNLDTCYNYLKAEFPIDTELLSEIYSLSISYLMKGKTLISDVLNDNLDSIVNNPQSPK